MLITKDGTIGKLILVENLPGDATLNSGIFVVRPLYNQYSTKFYFWLLQSSVFTDFIGIHKTGSTIVHLYQDTFENLPYGLPSIEEQTQIARFLDYETARIDALIVEQQRLIELLKEKRQAVVSHAVTKGLDPNVPMKDSDVEWLGEVPAHWDVCSLRRVIEKVEQGWSPECESSPASDGQWGVLKAGCVNRGVFSEKENKTLPVGLAPKTEYEINPGDVLVSRASGSPELVGSSAIVTKVRKKLMLSDKIFRIHLEEKIDSRYFVLSMNSIGLREQIVQALSGGNGLANNLPQAQLVSFKIAVPPLREQLNLIDKVTAALESIDKLVSEGELATRLLKERRSALISAAVTGKIDVRNWQPPADKNSKPSQQEAANG